MKIDMTIKCVWEHNGNDTLLYAVDYISAYTRGESLEVAMEKMPDEISAYLRWCGNAVADDIEETVVEEKNSELRIKDADSDVLFESEKTPLSAEKHENLKSLALKSALDFLALYESVPDKSATVTPARKTFYGQTSRSADATVVMGF